MHYQSKKYVPYLLLVPSLIVVVLFIYFPALEAFKMSFYKQSPFGLKKIYVGLANYKNIFSDPLYLKSLSITVLFVIFSVVVGLCVSLLFAVLLNQKLKGINLYRTIFFTPYAISPVVAGSLWIFLLNPAAGHLNYILNSLFNINPNWLTDGKLALLAVAIAFIWKYMGFNIIFFLAGLQGIPDNLYEAAMIDGSSSTKTFFKITLPLLSPTTFYLIIMNIIYAFFESFGLIDIMTQGGPANSTNILIYNLYRDSFVNFKPGLAAAQSIILLLIVGLITIIQFRIRDVEA